MGRSGFRRAGPALPAQSPIVPKAQSPKPKAFPPRVAAPIVLVVATLAAYQPAWNGAPVWDDDGHITRVDLRSGEGLARIWLSPGATQQYYPLAHSAFWLQHRLWADDPRGYHLVNIVLHALSACLLALMLRRLAVPGAWLAAFVFALHPVHVESVAWISELKNVLSGFFYLAAALVWLRLYDAETLPTASVPKSTTPRTGSVGARRRRAHAARVATYGLSLSLFVLAALTKTVTVTLPAALLIAMWWRDGWPLAPPRSGHAQRAPTPTLALGRPLRGEVLRLIPFFLLGGCAALVTIWFERTLIGAAGSDFDLTLVERGLVAGRALWFYLAKLLWPATLTFIYPRWNVSQTEWWQYLYPLGVIGLLAAAWIWRGRSRATLAALLYFLVTLFPALGFFNIYPFRYSFVADHFQYLASIGIIALICGGLATLLHARHGGPASPSASVGPASLPVWLHSVTLAAAVCLVGTLAFLTWRQAHDYTDAETLYRATLARNPASWMAHNNLAVEMLRAGGGDDRVREAAAHAAEAIRLRPGTQRRITTWVRH